MFLISKNDVILFNGVASIFTKQAHPKGGFFFEKSNVGTDTSINFCASLLELS
jgi:hypothetical protein